MYELLVPRVLFFVFLFSAVVWTITLFIPTGEYSDKEYWEYGKLHWLLAIRAMSGVFMAISGIVLLVMALKLVLHGSG